MPVTMLTSFTLARLTIVYSLLSAAFRIRLVCGIQPAIWRARTGPILHVVHLVPFSASRGTKQPGCSWQPWTWQRNSLPPVGVDRCALLRVAAAAGKPVWFHSRGELPRRRAVGSRFRYSAY